MRHFKALFKQDEYEKGLTKKIEDFKSLTRLAKEEGWSNQSFTAFGLSSNLFIAVICSQYRLAQMDKKIDLC